MLGLQKKEQWLPFSMGPTLRPGLYLQSYVLQTIHTNNLSSLHFLVFSSSPMSLLNSLRCHGHCRRHMRYLSRPPPYREVGTEFNPIPRLEIYTPHTHRDVPPFRSLRRQRKLWKISMRIRIVFHSTLRVWSTPLFLEVRTSPQTDHVVS